MPARQRQRAFLLELHVSARSKGKAMLEFIFYTSLADLLRMLALLCAVGGAGCLAGYVRMRR